MVNVLAVLWVLVLVGGVGPAWAGAPDPTQQSYQQQWIADTVQTVKDNEIPRGDLLKQLVLALAEEVGFGKALIWMALLPVLMLVGVVLGVWKALRKKT